MFIFISSVEKMVKRKQKTTVLPTNKISKTCNNGDIIIPNEEQKEKLIPFDFDENDCDISIVTKDKEINLPSIFLEMVSNGEMLPIIEGTINIDEIPADIVVQALSYYVPKYWEDFDESKYNKIRKNATKNFPL